MEETAFATWQQEFIEMGEGYVSELIGQEVDFSNPPADYAPSEETLNEFQLSAENAINEVIANFTSGETDSTLPAPVAEGATDSVDTQQQLIQTGITQIPSFRVGSGGSDTMTGSGAGDSSTSAYNVNFVPAEEGTGNIGEVQLTMGEGEPTTLFTLGDSGPVSASDGQQTDSSGFMPSFVSDAIQTGIASVM